jgi:hypothetical protein
MVELASAVDKVLLELGRGYAVSRARSIGRTGRFGTSPVSDTGAGE